MARKEIEDIDIETLIRILQKRPDLRERLREVLLTEEERQLPLQIKQLVEAIHELTLAHREGITRIERLEGVVGELVKGLRLAQNESEQFREVLMEIRYFYRASSLFGFYVGCPRNVDVGEFLGDLFDQGHTFTEEEGHLLSAIDMLLSARHPKTGQPIYIVLEVTWMVYPVDVERSYQQAEILRARGLEVYPAVAGKGIHPEANELVERHRVILLLDSKMVSRGGLGG